MPGEYDLTEDAGPGKLTITIAGDKGEGKTTTALMLPGTKFAISLDQKTTLTKEWLESIVSPLGAKVWNGVRYYSEDASNAETIVEAAHRSYYYLHALLDSFKANPPDWIIFDDVETLHLICEGEMRFGHKLGPVEGFANMNLWKERRMFLRSLHNKAKTIANKGVVYTTYMDFVQEIVENEKTVSGKKVPRWIDAVLKETDIALHAYYKDDVSGRRKYFVKVLSSKKHTFIQEGMVVDVSSARGPDFTKLFSVLSPISPPPVKIIEKSPPVKIIEKSSSDDDPFS
jgi:hypothetical protein